MSKLSRATKHVMILWVVAVALALPQALQFGITQNKGVTMCLQTQIIIEHSFELSTFFFFFAPMILITVLYALIGIKLRETSTGKEPNQKDFGRSIRQTHKLRRKHSQSTRRVVRMLVAVVVAFFVCWAPFHAQRLVAIYGTAENHMAKTPMMLSVYSFITYMSGVFYYMSTCINPIFYHIMSNKFRDAFKNTIASWCRRSDDKTATKRTSYTAMAFARNPTSSGNSSKNSLRNDTSLRYKTRRQDSKERNLPTMHICHNGKTIVTTPVQDYNECKKHSSQHLIKEEVIEAQHPCDGRPSHMVNDKRTPYSSVCCADHRSPTDTIASTPDAVITSSSEDKSTLFSDEPEKYLKEIKLRIVQLEKEYG